MPYRRILLCVFWLFSLAANCQGDDRIVFQADFSGAKPLTELGWEIFSSPVAKRIRSEGWRAPRDMPQELAWGGVKSFTRPAPLRHGNATLQKAAILWYHDHVLRHVAILHSKGGSNENFFLDGVSACAGNIGILPSGHGRTGTRPQRPQ